MYLLASTMTYSNWLSGEPNARSATCLKASNDGNNDFKWSDEACSQKFNYVCERGIDHFPIELIILNTSITYF